MNTFLHRFKVFSVKLPYIIGFIVWWAYSSQVFSETTNNIEMILNVNDFDKSTFEEVRFKKETSYHLIQLDSTKAIRAESQASASGLLRKKTINLSETPYLNWSWRVEKTIPALTETSKAGDDYAARIYLIHSGGWFFWQTKALNYVWSSRESKEQSWPNAYAPDNALMKAVRDQSDKSGVWFSEKRHVQDDFKSWLGEKVDQIDGVAIMTDTDDSGSHAVVYYGDIFFSAY